MQIFPIGTRVDVVSGELEGFSGTVTNWTDLGGANLHLVELDNPTLNPAESPENMPEIYRDKWTPYDSSKHPVPLRESTGPRQFIAPEHLREKK